MALPAQHDLACAALLACASLASATILAWGWKRLGSDDLVRRERAKLAVEFGGPALAMSLAGIVLVAVRHVAP